jgi:hypothetical protein
VIVQPHPKIGRHGEREMMADLVQITTQELTGLDDVALVRRCIEPTIFKIRGTDMAWRLRVYATLTSGQKALLGFWIVFTHGRNGWSSLHADLQHLMGHDQFWAGIKHAARSFGLPELLDSTQAFERQLAAPAPNPMVVARLDERLVRSLPEGIRVVASFVRANPAEFVRVGG